MPENQQKQMVCGFCFNEDGSKVVLVQKRRSKWYAGFLYGVEGKIEPNESPEQAMAREFEEETGLGTVPEQWNEIVVLQGDDGRVTFFYLHVPDEMQAMVRTTEAEQVGIYPTLNLPDNVIYNLRWLIPMALDNKIVKPLGLRGIF